MLPRSRTTIVLAVLALILLLVVGYEGEEHQHLTTALGEERAYALSLEQQISDLVGVNNHLRDDVIALHENLSRTATLGAACAQALAPLAKPSSLSGPQSRVAPSAVRITNDAVVITVNDVTPGIIGPTRSMAPVLDNNTLVLEITPLSPAGIRIGDIIIYEYGSDRIIHRVIRTGVDDHGWYAFTKGDNNPREDPLRVRFDQVRGLVVGIIY